MGTQELKNSILTPQFPAQKEKKEKPSWVYAKCLIGCMHILFNHCTLRTLICFSSTINPNIIQQKMLFACNENLERKNCK
jgi:hypothetical protein